MSLYQKHRPKTPADLVGCTAAQDTLAKWEDGGVETIPHAILFAGPSGTGKTTLGRMVARMVACSKLDYTELDSADFRGIDTIRDLRQKVGYAPRKGPCRVWLLDECHQLSKDAQNALLKVLEDTPKHVYLFLATTEPEKLLTTVRSRCTRVDTALLTPPEMGRDLLRPVCKAEGVKVPKAVLQRIAQESMGCARMGLVMLESVIGLPKEKMMAAVVAWESGQADTRKLCRLLLDGKEWKEVSELLGQLKGTSDPEYTRLGIMGYMTAVMLNPRGGSGNRARYVAECFSESFFYSKFNGLVACCWDAVHVGDD